MHEKIEQAEEARRVLLRSQRNAKIFFCKNTSKRRKKKRTLLGAPGIATRSTDATGDEHLRMMPGFEIPRTASLPDLIFWKVGHANKKLCSIPCMA